MNSAHLAITLIFVSAISHALVSVLMKRSHDKLVLRIILGVTSGLIALPFVFILPPLPDNVWPILLLGVSIHLVYQVIQASAFTRGDMSLVYPVMRGFAPALTAVFTSLYTVVDAAGVRLAPVKFSFIAWLFVLEGLIGASLFSYWKRAGLGAKIRKDGRAGILAGFLGLITYTTALYAFSLDDVAPLAALRETSVIFGAVFAAVLLKEPFGKRRIGLASLLVAGLALMQIT